MRRLVLFISLEVAWSRADLGRFRRRFGFVRRCFRRSGGILSVVVVEGIEDDDLMGSGERYWAEG